jgi:integrase
VATAQGARAYADGGHLYLSVDANHNRRWVFIYARNGRTREISIGTFPALSLADARKQRDAMNAALARGEPLAGPRQKDVQTFGAVAAEVIKRRAAAWRGGVSAYHWRVSINQHCAALFNRPIAAVTTDDVLRILSPLHERCPSFAQITRARIEDVFNYAQARGLLPQDRANPADRRRLQILLPAAPKAVHRAALPYADVPALVAELRSIPLADARVVVARALEFVILAALRVREACCANWSEIDFNKRLLTVPATRMKAGKEHVVPLPKRAVEIVREMEALWGDNGVVFVAQRHAGAIDGARLRQLLKALRPDVHVHGFRSSFRDWAGDHTAFPREVAEAALAHIVGGVEGTYRRGTALEKRAELMEAWARFCERETEAKVVRLRP